MGNDITVSVIVPVYNSENTVSITLDSIIQQKGEIEIICVDDCSTDKSLEILRQYEKSDSRIRIIAHDVNKGTLISRYDAVMAASGKYIMFADADDRLLPDACIDLSKMMDDTAVDMIHFDIAITGNAPRGWITDKKEQSIPYMGKLCGEEVFQYQFSKHLSWNLWNRIYKASLCKKAYSAMNLYNIHYATDVFYIFYISYYAQSYLGIGNKYYEYHFGKGVSTDPNVSKMSLIKRYCPTAELTKDCISFLKNEGKYERYGGLCYNFPLSYYDDCVEVICSSVDDKESMSKMVHESFREIICNKEFFDNNLYNEKYCIEHERSIIKLIKRLYRAVIEKVDRKHKY